MEACNLLIEGLRRVRAKVEGHFRDAAIRRELRAELAGLSGGDLDRVLADIGVSREEMETVIRNAPRSRMLLRSMLRRLDLDRTVSLAPSQEMRAIERRCATCDHQKQCGDWINTGATGDTYRRFCPNAAAFDSLSLTEKAA